MKKIIFSLVIIVMAASLTAQVSVWDGTYEEFDMSNDKGLTEDNPILIENAAQLAYMSTLLFCIEEYRDLYYKLTTDVDLNNLEWKPIGFDPYVSCPGFNGYFDGDNHNIFQLSGPLFYDCFGYIKNIVVKETTINAGKCNSFGVISQYCASMIENCHNYADINIEPNGDVNMYLYVGGITGGAGGSVIKHCTNHGDINIHSDIDANIFVGGIHSRDIKAYNVSNYGNINISGSKVNDISIGGVAVMADEVLYSSNCGNINIEIDNYNSITCGGISATITGDAKINCCFNKGDIFINTMDDSDNLVLCGGITGNKIVHQRTSEINNCYNTGSIYAGDNAYAGGILGMYTFDDNLPPYSNVDYVKITSCYNIGTLDAKNTAGIVAFTKNDTIVTADNNYMADYNDNNGYGESLSTDVMKTEEFITMLNKHGFYFTKDVEPFSNDGYPVIDYSNMNETIGVDETESEVYIEIYPNPASDFVKLSAISGQPLVVRIYNTLGMLVEEIEMNSKEIEINISDYKSGMYFINIKTENGNITKKMVVR